MFGHDPVPYRFLVCHELQQADAPTHQAGQIGDDLDFVEEHFEMILVKATEDRYAAGLERCLQPIDRLGGGMTGIRLLVTE